MNQTNSTINSTLDALNEVLASLNFTNITSPDLSSLSIFVEGVNGTSINISQTNLLELLAQQQVNLTVKSVIESLIGAQNRARGFLNSTTPTAVIQIPVDPIIDLLVNSIVIPNSLGFNYQVVEGFD